MNHLQRTLLSILFLIPISAVAHGQEVLMILFIQAVSVIIFLIVIFAIKVDLKRKLILAGVYFLSSFATIYFTNDWSYRENMDKINLLVALVPATAFLIAFLALKSRPNGQFKTTKE